MNLTLSILKKKLHEQILFTFQHFDIQTEYAYLLLLHKNEPFVDKYYKHSETSSSMSDCHMSVLKSPPCEATEYFVTLVQCSRLTKFSIS